MVVVDFYLRGQNNWSGKQIILSDGLVIKYKICSVRKCLELKYWYISTALTWL